MITFILLLAFFALVTGVIFKTNIKNHIISVILIIFIGTLIGNIIVAQFYGAKIPYNKVHKKYSTDIKYTNIINKKDTLLSSIGIFYAEDTNNVKINKIKFGKIVYFNLSDSNSFSIKLDTCKNAYMIKTKYIRQTNEKWATTFELPNKPSKYEIHIPKNKTNIMIINLINKYYYGSKKS